MTGEAADPLGTRPGGDTIGAVDAMAVTFGELQ